MGNCHLPLGPMAKGCEAAPEPPGEDSSAVGYREFEVFATFAKYTQTYFNIVIYYILKAC